MNSVLKKDQVYQTLRRQILSGEYKPNEQLPGEFDLAGHFGVSCVTLRSSLRILEEEKLIYRVPRKGTFITPLQQNHNYLIIASSCNAIANPDPYIIQGMEKAAEAAGCGLKTIALEFIRGQSPEYTFELLNKNSIGGVFLMGNNYKGNETEIQILNKIKIPTILPHGLIKDRPYVNCPMLLTDIQTAFAEGIRHLISLGHHRIATIALQSSPLPKNIRDFEYTEYLDFLSQEGASPDSSLVCFTTCTYESIRNSIIGLLRSPFPPTAIMCYSDFFAIHVYKILNELNIKIPEDISVMGFCGYFGGQFMNPPLSTVDFMYEEIGRNALDLMLRSNEWFPYQKAPMTIFTPYRMLVRKSTIAANHFIYDAL